MYAFLPAITPTNAFYCIIYREGGHRAVKVIRSNPAYFKAGFKEDQLLSEFAVSQLFSGPLNLTMRQPSSMDHKMSVESI